MTRKVLLAATVLASLTALPAAAQPVTGLYIAGGGGANFLQQERLQSFSIGGITTPVTGRTPFDAGVVAVGSVGWGFGNGLRTELEGDYRNNRFSKPGLGFTSFGGREQKYGPMINVLFDLDVGSPYVFPYVGGGVGYQWVAQKAQQSSPGTTTNLNGTDGSFAYQAIAGLSFPVPPVVGLSLTAEYRYFSLAGDRTYGLSSTGVGAFSGRQKTTDNYNHSLLLGLRYAFNVAPPPIEVPAAPAAPQAQAARTYLVFFDWDRADLTERARQIIAEAAQATTRVQVTRIEVQGHTDTSGTAAYNQGLSVRRAQVVAAELVRLGVPRASITTQGFGFSRPLVATGPGVREPQNRRVEIILR